MNNLNKDKYICEEKCFLKFIEDLVPTERSNLYKEFRKNENF